MKYPEFYFTVPVLNGQNSHGNQFECVAGHGVDSGSDCENLTNRKDANPFFFVANLYVRGEKQVHLKFRQSEFE